MFALDRISHRISPCGEDYRLDRGFGLVRVLDFGLGTLVFGLCRASQSAKWNPRPKTKDPRPKTQDLSLLRCSDRSNHIIIFGFEETNRAHIAVTQHSLGVNHEYRARHSSRYQRLCAIQF